MATPKSGSLIKVYIRPYGSTESYKEIVCSEDLSLDGSADAIERVTKCGTLKAAGIPSFEVSGTGTWDSAASASQVSALEIFDYGVSQSQLDVRITDSLTTPVLVDFTGNGYLTSFPINMPAEDLVNFDFTISINGNMQNDI